MKRIQKSGDDNLVWDFQVLSLTFVWSLGFWKLEFVYGLRFMIWDLPAGLAFTLKDCPLEAPKKQAPNSKKTTDQFSNSLLTGHTLGIGPAPLGLRF